MVQGKLLRELRRERGLAQDAVARELGVSRPSYIAIEQGKKELSLSQAERVSRIFDISLDAIVAGRRQKIFIAVKRPLRSTKRVLTPKKAMRISIPKKNYDKFKQVLLYVLDKVGGKPNIGMTALYKLLYFIDFDYYEKYEEQLMGATYMRNHYGPTPIEFKKIVSEMEKDDLLEEVETKYFQHGQKKFLSRSKPDLSLLTGQEIGHIDETLARLGDKNANELTELSHRDVPWLAAPEGGIIDYESVFYRAPETSRRSYETDSI